MGHWATPGPHLGHSFSLPLAVLALAQTQALTLALTLNLTQALTLTLTLALTQALTLALTQALAQTDLTSF